MPRTPGPSSVGNTQPHVQAAAPPPKPRAAVPRKRSSSLDHAAPPSPMLSHPTLRKVAPPLVDHGSGSSRSRAQHSSSGVTRAPAPPRDSHGRHGGGEVLSTVRNSQDLFPYSPNQSRHTSDTDSGGSAENAHGAVTSAAQSSAVPYQFKPGKARGGAGRAGTSLDDVTVLEGKGTAVLLHKGERKSDARRGPPRSLSEPRKTGGGSESRPSGGGGDAAPRVVGFSSSVQIQAAADRAVEWVELETAHLDNLSLQEVLALVKLDARIRRGKAKLLRARGVPRPWKRRTKRAAARLYAWAANLQAAQDLERLELGLLPGEPKPATGHGAAARRVRRDALPWPARAALAAKHRVDHVVAVVLFAVWGAALVWVLLWMLNVFPNTRGYPVDTWVPTRCARGEYAAANPVLCGEGGET